MKRTLSIFVSLCSVISTVGLAQSSPTAPLSNATITYTVTVPAHTETFEGKAVSNLVDHKIYGTEWTVRNSPTPKQSANITASGSILSQPAFAWLKDPKLANQISSSGSSKTGGARVKFNRNLLVRETNFDASTGKTSGTFHQVYSVSTVQQKQQPGDSELGATDFVIPVSSTDAIRQSLENDIETASSSVLSPLAEVACQGMCLLKFQGATASGLDVANIKVSAFQTGVKPGRTILIEWPTYTITSTFTLAAKTKADLDKESQGN